MNEPTIDNEPLKNTILDILNHNDAPVDVLIEEIIKTVAEDLHEFMYGLLKDYTKREYIAKMAFTATMDQIFHIKFGSEYEQEIVNVAKE